MPENSNALRRGRAPRKTISASRASATGDVAGTASGVNTAYLETLLGYNARRAALAVISVFLHRMAPYDLRPVDFSVLSVVANNPGVTSRQICTALDILPPNLVGMIKSLHLRGLVERLPHPSDRRAQGLHLTEAGKLLYAQAQTTATTLEHGVTERITPDELDTLNTLLRKVYTR